MINLTQYEEKLKKNNIDNCYIFCGIDEELIKENIKNLLETVLNKDFIDLNYVKIDGNTLDSFDKVINACETLPFMSDKKVVLVYRSNFLDEGEDNNKKKLFNELKEYVKSVPESCILIFYYIFKNKREKPSKKIYALDSKCTVIKADKIYGKALEMKVKSIFDKKDKNIGNVELKLFCSNIPNDMGILENEVEKLCCYTIDRDIKREDIYAMYPKKNDDDIFDLVDFIGDKKVKDALKVLNELIYKGEDIPVIIYMIERQFKLLYNIKQYIEDGKDKNFIASKIKLPNFIIERLIRQSKKFTLKQIKGALYICLNVEEKIKSSSLDKKTEMELLIIETITA
ncbi:DNA polymerase-3 subunit delta [Clostridium tetanomorphum]|uniref:DNA polymerase III subunit delta n=1 Tax=Clostridium tetanomorphum TaxID=1553 RepID=A0A923J1H1_CLOTT|nr:DNA polymerase III subunit delta [Clostridium tetanomorphum]MBC2397358.1 DNA polymerase III subunit delta [Clostridium tetanomorphum]MBP1862578.1 DNA polymerase-3 subunit delta [Clostridium tetanomorphum]NRS85581.1 DNA polymerase-3 subunit delta [Clostridium tetanomorphum]NRZ96408.1 DNA polymerase-3 subunit delta [Clostridium tetanomorphum]SQC02696.1 DNA polymerase III subunit delta [Clostridium tetanomorphum]